MTDFTRAEIKMKTIKLREVIALEKTVITRLASKTNE